MKKTSLFPLIVITLLFACGKKNNSPAVSTLAGTGTMGAVDGKGAEASFGNPMGVAVDSAGNVYVADSRNDKIRKITPDGAVTTLAGNGKDGSADGQSGSASFFFPVALAAGTDGSVYVADTHNSLLRRISASGAVTTIAGKDPAQTKDLPDTLRRLDNPYGIAVAKDGSVYFTNWAKDLVQKMAPDGKITVVAGNNNPGAKDGIGAAASFYLPEGIAIDGAGNLYVADCYNNMIRKITADGHVTTLAGKPGKKNFGSKDGKGPAASFSHPCGIAVDKKGNVYIADVGNNKIRRITPDGTVSTLAGSGERGSSNGDPRTASFYHPYGVAVDRDGNVYVADYQNNLIRKISL
ncbi:MAG TPA: NHL repeat-containing protein [Mucilaginibacter sp.]|nr:NHL repeat-containing protein [Mucilaginibacter sp.]